MKTIVLIASILLSSLSLSAQVKDIDGNTYKTVNIGKQSWLESNLNTTRFSNGDSIFYAKNMEQWKHAMKNKIPACCDYEFNPENSLIFGKLYNHFATTDPRGLAPIGCAIPTKKDCKELLAFVGDSGEKGDRVGDRLKSTTGWWDEKHNGNNNSGFNLVTGGRINALPYFWHNEQAANIWLKDRFGLNHAYSLSVWHSCMGTHTTIEHYRKRIEAFAVRCIKV